MIDWGYPSRKDRFLTIDDHVNGYLDHAVDFIRRKHNLPRINLMGICMGGSFSVMYAALHPEKVKNLITTVTPTHFDTDTGLLHIWMKALDAFRIVDTFGNSGGSDEPGVSAIERRPISTNTSVSWRTRTTSAT